MRNLILTVIALTLVSTSAFAQSQEALDTGKIFVKTQKVKGFEIEKIIVKGVVDSPPAKVWEVISNCDEFESRMPRIKSAKIVKTEGKYVTCDVTVDLPWPLANLHAVTKAIHKAGPKVWTRRWKMVKGDYKFNTGGFVLKTFKDDPNRTLIVYQIHADPKTMIPDGIRETAQKKSLPNMIKRIGKEAAKL